MAHRAERLVGHLHGGCSPVAMPAHLFLFAPKVEAALREQRPVVVRARLPNRAR